MTASNGDRKSAQATLAQFKHRLVYRVSNFDGFLRISLPHSNKILRQAIQYATAAHDTTTSSQSQSRAYTTFPA